MDPRRSRIWKGCQVAQKALHLLAAHDELRCGKILVTNGPLNPVATGAAPVSGNTRSLVLRVWLEPDPPHLRARVVEIAPGLVERSVVVTTSIDEVCQAVRNWLEDLQAEGIGKNSDGTVTHKG